MQCGVSGTVNDGRVPACGVGRSRCLQNFCPSLSKATGLRVFPTASEELAVRDWEGVGVSGRVASDGCDLGLI